MDSIARRRQRTGSPAEQLADLKRVAGGACEPHDCPHCSREVRVLEVVCGPCRGIGHRFSPPVPGPPLVACLVCNGTGRVPFEWPQRLDLAAYAGDERARAMVPEARSELCSMEGCGRPMHEHPIPKQLRSKRGWAVTCVGVPTLPLFLSGLGRWQGASLVAGLAAGWAVLPTWEARHAYQTAHRDMAYCCEAPRQALQAATDCARCGCAAAWEAWEEACRPLRNGGPMWVSHPTDSEPGEREVVFESAADEIGEAPVRAAVCAGLVGWSIEGRVPCGR